MRPVSYSAKFSVNSICEGLTTIELSLPTLLTEALALTVIGPISDIVAAKAAPLNERSARSSVILKKIHNNLQSFTMKIQHVKLWTESHFRRVS